jgi:hypothetical protein
MDQLCWSRSVGVAIHQVIEGGRALLLNGEDPSRANEMGQQTLMPAHVDGGVRGVAGANLLRELPDEAAGCVLFC